MEYELPDSVEVQLPIYCKPLVTYKELNDGSVSGMNHSLFRFNDCYGWNKILQE